MVEARKHPLNRSRFSYGSIDLTDANIDTVLHCMDFMTDNRETPSLPASSYILVFKYALSPAEQDKKMGMDEGRSRRTWNIYGKVSCVLCKQEGKTPRQQALFLACSGFQVCLRPSSPRPPGAARRLKSRFPPVLETSAVSSTTMSCDSPFSISYTVSAATEAPIMASISTPVLCVTRTVQSTSTT